ncbi:uncharacterized protein LOC120657488 isoform X2 [Panicum virgatum]|uniref:uncharacterized protein LOC120657488 isoform X2 n=1 Tax=Panicum virgatum TaxID=38727 RepID=UPI0019D688CA|nr:uncharacterized protein LOC120657488 isoform X2 [Panicum virgatum]
MNLLCWNCRGLGTDSTVGELRHLVKRYRPSLLFLSETKMRDTKVRKFMWSLGFHGCFAVSSEGKSGGLALFWVQECIVSLKHYSPNIIDVTIGSEANQLWRASFVYGEPRSKLRHNFWDLLRFVRSQWSGPWLCAGDFNEVLSSDEHLSRGERGEQQMRLFRDCLEDGELSDLGFSGPKYTWNNRQVGSDNVKVRLDRAVANGHFIQLFEDYHVENVITSTSDHYAILVSINRDSQYNDRSSFDNNFKYEAMWARAPDYNDIVEKKWKEDFEGPRNLQSFWSNLSRMATSLKHWSSRTFGSIRKEIKKLERQLAMLRSSSATPAFSVEERRIERKLCDLFECEEIMARQRSRVDWLQAGDRNTSFFHARASARRKTNRISYLLREDGTRCEDREELKDEEIREALFQMGPTKAPGPDGFPALFYQRHWDFLQADICTAVRDFLQDMMKAYDRVEWKYLQGVLSKMGFADGWIQTVMKCVTKVRYAIRVNGELSEHFIPTRGLRQGDPISPYLFLLCAEGLSCLMKKKEAEGKINGVKNGRTGPAISHLLFVDDSIFFIRGDMKNLQALNEVLHLYSEGTGQRINFQKSSLFFGDKCPEQVKDRIKSYINVRNVVVQANYLDMPSWVGRSPTSTFNFLPERMWRKIRGWNDRPLSRAAAICDKMRTTISNHWWGIEEGKKKMHWRSWEWLTAPKAMGGMGFRDMQIFNQAMLGKQAWRILTVPNSLCARVLKGRYFPCCSFWDASQPRSSSFTWRSIMYDGAAGSWNEEMVRACFNEDDAEKILQIPLCHTPCEDFPAWLHTKSEAAEDHEATVFAITVWHIWESRNAVRNGENMMHPQSIAQRAVAYIEMFLLHVTQPKNQRCESNFSVSRWTPPPIGRLMLNVDAALFKNPSRIGVGVVIRDHDGDFKMAFCKVMDRIKDPEMAEAMAVRCAVIFAKEKNLQHIVVASDCHNIIKKLQSQNLDRSEVGAIICDIKNLVREVTFSFMYIRRSCNGAAHVMARLADQFSESVWCNEAPDAIRAILCNDLYSN